MKEPKYLAALRAEANFLPAWYVERRLRRRAHRLQVALLLIVAAGVAVLIADAERTRSRLRAEHAALRQQLGDTHRAMARVEALREDHADRARRLDLHRRLHRPIGYSQIAGTLASLTPPSIALRSIDMQNDRAPARRRAAEDGRSSRQARKRGGAEAPTRPIIAIDLEGIAPSDVDVANLLGALSASELFADARLLYARQGAREDLITRLFHVRLQVPLDRTYQPAESAGVADAH